MKKLTYLLFAALASSAVAGDIKVTNVEARQRYPWNGKVDIAVTLCGASNDVSEADCLFSAINGSTKDDLTVSHISKNGNDTGSGTTWTRRFVWDASLDLGSVKIDDIALTVDAKIFGGVQLWENGPYWAECNVGAANPEDSGYYFWCGDKVGCTRNVGNDGWVSVENGSAFEFGSIHCWPYYKTVSSLELAGYIDSTGNLSAARDAAVQYLGLPWRMPTDAEFEMLISKCESRWEVRDGVQGRVVVGKGAFADKSIFLPAAGFGRGGDLHNISSLGYYWSSTPTTDNDEESCCIIISPNTYDPLGRLSDCNRSDFYRPDGLSIRPVRESVQ